MQATTLKIKLLGNITAAYSHTYCRTPTLRTPTFRTPTVANSKSLNSSRHAHLNPRPEDPKNVQTQNHTHHDSTTRPQRSRDDHWSSRRAVVASQSRDGRIPHGALEFCQLRLIVMLPVSGDEDLWKLCPLPP